MGNCCRDEETIEEIKELKSQLGQKLLILTHHYQRKEIVELGHFRGDSFELSRRAAEKNEASFIVFCGVHFMAESAAILSEPGQVVQIPDPGAGCPMADMADADVVEEAWKELTSLFGDKSIMPVVYMNSDASLKAFCGRNGGTVCTSSNAERAFRWGLTQGKKIFFFPDRHLGLNTAYRLRIRPDEIVVWESNRQSGGVELARLKGARVILWDGYCVVHTRFRPEHVVEMRERFPGAKIVVHPECTREVVELADAVGSTGFIVNYVENAPPGSTIIIGTEINLVDRLAHENPDKNIFDLYYSLCPNMFKITPEKLRDCLREIGGRNVISVPEHVKKDALVALNRMLELPHGS